MAESRFALSHEIIVDQLKLDAKNKNTTKTTQTWLNVCEKWANERKFNPKDLEDVDKKLQMFYAEVRAKDWLEYEPESLKSMQAALDRNLKENDYKFAIIRDRELYQSKLVFEGKVKSASTRGSRQRSVLPSRDRQSQNRSLVKKQRLGVNSIDGMMKNIIKDTPL